MRRLASVAGIVAALCAARADAAGQRYALGYDVYNGGFHVLKLNLDIDLGRDAYAVTARYETAGIMGWVLPMTSVAQSKGVIRDGLLHPSRHRVDGTLWGRPRMVEILYRDGLVSDVKVLPPPREDNDREEVGEAERRGARDPISALLAAVWTAQQRGGCGERQPVFDGRRRYDITFEDRGMVRLDASDANRFAGEARQCNFVYVPIKGYERTADDSEKSRLDRHGRVWLAPPVPGGPVAPVRLEMDSNWGATMMHLREARREVAGGQGAGASRVATSTAAGPAKGE